MIDGVTKKFSVGGSLVQVGRWTYGVEHIKVRQWGEGAGLKIGKFCSIADNITVFLGGNHRTDWVTTYPFGHIYQDEFGDTGAIGHPATRGDVSIGNDVWIGAGVTIMSGVTVGDGAVLAANSVVTSNVGPYEIVGGNPSRFIKGRFDDEIRDLLLSLRWWDLDVPVIKMILPLLCTEPSSVKLRELLARYRQLSLPTSGNSE